MISQLPGFVLLFRPVWFPSFSSLFYRCLILNSVQIPEKITACLIRYWQSISNKRYLKGKVQIFVRKLQIWSEIINLASESQILCSWMRPHLKGDIISRLLLQLRSFIRTLLYSGFLTALPFLCLVVLELVALVALVAPSWKLNFLTFI